MMIGDNCHVEAIEKPLDRLALSDAMAAYLSIGGMGCPNCAMRVRNGLLSLEGVLLAEVYLEQGVAAAAYDPQQVNTDLLVQAVARSGNDGRHHYWAELIQEVPAAQALNL